MAEQIAGLWRDTRHAVRALRQTPLFSLTAILSLTLGIGANTALFSLLDDAVLQPLPVTDPRQLRSAVVMSRDGAVMSNVPSEFFQELRRSPRAFSGVFASWRSEMNLDTGSDVERVLVQYASGGYYATLGIPMALGRAIGDADEASDDRVAVISHRYWQRRFGGDAGVLGRVVHLDGRPATIVGVTPSSFFGVDRGLSPDITLPLPRVSPVANLWVTMRMKPGVSEAEALTESQAALDRALVLIAPRLSRYRASERDAVLALRAGLQPAAYGLGVAMRSYLQPLRLLLMLSAGVLLIACVNVANLLLARALARAHEFGVRVALGATRARIVGEVLLESVILAAGGAAAGIGVAFFLHRALVNLLMPDLAHRALAFELNGHVLAFSLAIALMSAAIAGVVPALRATRIDVRTALTAGAGRGSTRRTLARGLVVFQVAAALVLLIGAGLLLRTFLGLRAVDTGVAIDRTLTMKIGLDGRETQRRFSTRIYVDVIDRVSALPDIAAAALGWDFALGSGRSMKAIWVAGEPPDVPQSAGFNVVGPGFFATTGVPVVAGREFTTADDASGRKVVVVNEAWVRRFAPKRSAIGMHVGDEGAPSAGKYEVVGVVRDARTAVLRAPAGPMLYQPLLQDEWASNVVLHVRTRGNPGPVADRVRAAIRGVDSRVPVYDIGTLEDRLARALADDRMMAALSSALAAVALLLTAIGIYGVIAYSVGRRTAEIGIRVALGATATRVRWLVLRETLVVVAAGAAIGLPLSLASANVLKSTLYGVSPQDPWTAAAALTTVVVAGIVAGAVPSQRAARLEPMTALRQQ
jgi:predicted permease